jgi:hypothetical protein
MSTEGYVVTQSPTLPTTQDEKRGTTDLPFYVGLVASIRQAAKFTEQNPCVKPTRIAYVDGGSFSATDYYVTCIEQGLVLLTPGELGCVRSHLSVLSDFLCSDNVHDYCLVFEYDAKLSGLAGLHTVYDYLKSIVDGGSSGENCFLIHLGMRHFFGSDSRLVGKMNIFQGYKFWSLHPRLLDGLAESSAYVVNRAMARRIISKHQTKIFPFDLWTAYTSGECVVGYVRIADKGRARGDNSRMSLERARRRPVFYFKPFRRILQIWLKVAAIVILQYRYVRD